MKDYGKWTFGLGALLLLSGCASVRQLPPGDLVLTETMQIAAADSGTVFRGADDGSTRIVGGISIGGWTDRGNGVWGAKLPLDADGKPIFTETLFVNGRRAQRSRWPDKGYFHVTSVSQAVCTASATGFRHFIGLNPSEAKALAAVPADELKWAQFVVHVKWDVARYPIVAATEAKLAVDGAKLKGWNSWGNGDLYSFENLRSAFDAPGEWFYDAKAGEVLYRPLPGETVASAVVPRDGLETLVAVRGAADVTFENVTFAENAPVATKGPTSLPSWQAAAGVAVAAVTVDYSTNVVFRNCRFTRLGSYALWFREGVRGGGAYSCEMTDLGAGGVRIGVLDYPGRPKANQKLPPAKAAPNVPWVCTEPWMTSHVAVDDCLISDGGRFHPAGVGVLLTHASDCTVTHNEICDLYYTGVSVGWIWGYSGSPAQRNEISFNHIHDIGKAELADMGGIYTLGTSYGTCVSNNVIHGIRTYSYGGWGLYPDEGSEGIVLENNLVYDTDDASFHQHYGKDNILRNNVLLDSRAGQIAVSRDEPHRSLTAERNVVIWTKGDAFNKYGGTKSEKSKIDWRKNIWWRTDGKEVFNGTSFADWQKRVKDDGSVFAEPGFADWQARDFALKPGAAALEVGFKPFDPSLAGRRRGRTAALGSASTMSDGVIELRANGAKCRVNPLGGRILSLVQDGEEVLWNAEPMQQAAKDWAHGGIPLCWPWFGDNGKGEIHGTAWRKRFSVVSTRVAEGLAEVELKLREGDAELRYRIALADRLRLEAKVVNRGGSEFAFTIGYHPYFRATERDRVIVRDIDGLDFEDDPSFPHPQKGRWAGEMYVTNYVDRIFALPAGRKVVAVDGVRTGRSLELASENLTGLNVWNPGPEKNCPGNVPGDSWRRFVCVEPVRCGEAGVVRLAPGASQSFVFEVKSAPGAFDTAECQSSATSKVEPGEVRLTSPDGRNEIVLSRRADGSATWRVSRDGKSVLAPAALGLDLSPAPKPIDGEQVVRFQKSGTETTPIYKKGEIDHSSNWASVGVAEGVKVELVARNDGVAWRFVLNGRPDERIDVVRETADLRFADSASTLYAGVVEHGAAKASYWTSADPLQHSSETPFVKTTPDALLAGRANAVAYLPLTGRTTSGTWFAVKDTDVRDYPGWQLRREGRDLRGVFAAEPDPGQCFRTGVFCRVTARLGRLANVSRRRNLPWRCVLLADTPGGLAEADALYALAERPKGDFSWVKPGLCVWDWWCAHNIPDAPGLKPNSTEEYCHYIDFAAANGIPYFLIDGGWLQNNDLNCPRPGVDLPKTFAYAKRKGVKVIVWCAWVSLLEDLEHSMARFAAMGCSGFKIDFLDRDDVLASRFMWRAAAAAAEQRLVIDFHGCPVPNGLQRTYPNVLNFEAVRGLENAKWDEAVRDFPPHDVRLVFTRFLAGPADYTPGSFLHRTREGFAPTPKRPCVPGTRAHQMALYTLYEAPLQMLCDSPTQYRASPECLKFLAGTPATWDETRVLAGSPDDFAVMARRRGEVWQVGAITDWTARELVLDTTFLGDGRWTLEAFADAPDAGTAPERYVRDRRTVAAKEKLHVKLAPGGGWTGRFTRLEAGNLPR